MEYSKDKQYFVIETLRRNEFSATAIQKILKEAWPEECLSEEKRDSFGHQGGSGMDKSEKQVQAQEEIRQIIENDNFVSVRHSV